ncbi:MAG: GTP pyrophosphokinase family protein [Clostridia bacterium]|nr:GTP pyrophosphokinase family protein [Clostridia bacterium]
MPNDSIYGKYEAFLPLVLEELSNKIRQADAIYRIRSGDPLFEHINARIKSEESAREKCRRKGWPETPRSVLYEMKDAVGIRLVCSFLEDIFETVKAIRGFSGVEVIEEKDYIKKVKPNGYRSYHMILDIETPFEDVLGNVPGHYFAEIQLRTIAMDSWAALEHQLSYKKNISNPELIGAELKRCADELAACDVSMQTIRELIRNS